MPALSCGGVFLGCDNVVFGGLGIFLSLLSRQRIDLSRCGGLRGLRLERADLQLQDLQFLLLQWLFLRLQQLNTLAAQRPLFCSSSASLALAAAIRCDHPLRIGRVAPISRRRWPRRLRQG